MKCIKSLLLPLLVLSVFLLTSCGAVQTPVQQSPTVPELPVIESSETLPGLDDADDGEKKEEVSHASSDLKDDPNEGSSASQQVFAPAETPDAPEPDEKAETPAEDTLPEDGVYDDRDSVALYLHLYGHLPSNYISKKEAEALGWSGGSLEPFAPGKCIGGSRFGNYEGLLPEAKGRKYSECDIGTLGKSKRGAKRIVWSNDGLIYYTDDHYESFTLLYGEE